MSKIIIQRDSGYADRVRKYKVILNNNEIGQISNGETKEFDAPLGDNEVFIKIDWCRSNKICFDGHKDNIEQFNCGSSLRGIKLLFGIIYALFMPHHYLWLSNISNTN